MFKHYSALKEAVSNNRILGPVYGALQEKWRRFKLLKYRERRSKGFQPKEPFYFILRRESGISGICSDMMVYLEHLNYMESNYPKAVPLADMQNYANSLMDPADVGKYNAWDILFEPLGASVEQAYASKNYILSRSLERPQIRMNVSAQWLMAPNEDLEKWSALFHKYFIFNSSTRCFFQKLYQEVFPKQGRCLGVLCRGTDYIQMRPCGHPIQPSAAQMIQKCQQELKWQNYDYLVLATEDQGIAEEFRRTFGNKCVLTKNEYSPYKGGAYIDNIVGRAQNSLQYLGQLYLLSRCQGLISGITSAAPFILFMAEDKPFEYIYFWDLGIYQ